MEVFLYNSTVCRLCGEENDSGNLLYSSEDNNQPLCDLINAYLPLKVVDDGILPRTVCPGCTIQLEATVEFFNLIINGQKLIRELHQREKEYKKTILVPDNEPEVITENIVYEINTSNGVYKVEHPIALQVAGLERPKRKRGRPPKKAKTDEELAEEAAARERELEDKKQTFEEEPTGKRRRKAPTRFKEVVQGKELERIFKEEGVIDDETETDIKPDVSEEGQSGGEGGETAAAEPQVIGHVQDSGELVVVVKGKGRGRPKGRVRQTKEECAICGMEFSCVGRYMSHIAQHGPVIYQCAPCGHSCSTLIEHRGHQRATGHRGQNVIPCDTQPELNPEEAFDPLKQEDEPPSEDKLVAEPPSMPLLQDDTNLPTPNEKQEKESNEKPLAKLEEIETVTIGPKGKVRLQCGHCDKTFNTKQSKSLHIKAVHLGEKPYTCKVCGLAFAYPRSLALHALSHRRRRAQQQRYACDLCGKVLNHPSSVVYHKEAEHAGRAWVCGQCGKSFKHRQLLQRHQLVHSQARPHTCKTCDATFKTKANLVNHELLHSGVKRFACELCTHQFAHKTSLTLHMRWHTGTKPYGCKTCGKCFSQKGNLSEHERIHTGEKPFQCTLCPRKFTTSSQFRLHARRHQPDRPYACTHCPKRFASRGSWLAHQRREAGIRTHTCSVCSRAFAERWALHKHMRKHTGERPFACPHCPRTFADCSNLNKHKKQVHKQVSLLNKEALPVPLAPLAPVVPLSPVGTGSTQHSERPLTIAEGSDSGGEGEGVIYVTYDVSAGDTSTAYTIVDPEQAASIEDEKRMANSVFAGSSLLMPQPSLPLNIELESIAALESDTPFTETIAVTDEQGNPLHFTMQDGTRLAITSSDGQSLQVITQDGQTIPVEINEYNEEDDLCESGADAGADDSIVQQVNLHKAIAAEQGAGGETVTHYFTIV